MIYSIPHAQVVSVFDDLVGQDGLHACAVHHNAALRLLPSTALVVGLPRQILNYERRQFNHVHTVVYDEVDRLQMLSKEDHLNLHKFLLKAPSGKQSRRVAEHKTMASYSDGDGEIGDERQKCPSVTPDNRQFIALSATTAEFKNIIHPVRYIQLSSRPVWRLYPRSAYRLPDTASASFRLYEDTSDKKRLLVRTLQSLVPLRKTVLTPQECPRVVVFAVAAHFKEIQEALANVRLPRTATKQGKASIPAECWWHKSVAVPPPSQKAEDHEENSGQLEDFSSGKANLLLASGSYARGLDLPDVSAVIIYDFPRTVQDFFHYAGRTARAGASGKSKCTHALRHT